MRPRARCCCARPRRCTAARSAASAPTRGCHTWPAGVRPAPGSSMAFVTSGTGRPTRPSSGRLRPAKASAARVTP
eukprot:5014392-Lingulodinium_polyedra.AAC.1